MKNTLSYKGFTARIEFDPDDKIFFGRVLDIREILGFHGDTVKELKRVMPATHCRLALSVFSLHC